MTLAPSTEYEHGTRDWQLARIKEISANYFEYAKRNHKVKDKDGNIVPFILNSVQRKAAEAIITDLINGEPVRLILLKARQMGMSTLIESIISWIASTKKNTSAVITAHLSDAARNIYEMFRRYYDNSLPQFQPKLKYNTRSDLTFEKLGSQIKTGSAESGETGRGGTNQLLHNSEVAFWSNANELVAGLMQTVPYRPNTMVIHESTANGIGGYFYETYQAAKRGDSIFKPMFFAWFEMEEYRLKLPEGGIVLSASEQEMKAMYELDDEQIMWYRMKLREFGNDIDKMKQEYPSNDMEAFIVSGRPRFDINALIGYEKDAVEPTYGEIFEDNSNYRFREVDNKTFAIWKLPERLGQYAIGGDVAEGLEHGDYSVAQVIDLKTREQVARLRIHCDPDVFGDLLYDLGMFYNRAILGAEVNNHGLTTLQRLKERNYPNIYSREGGYDRILSDTSASTMGWKTDQRTKPLMIDYTAIAIREGSIIIHDKITIRECMTYVIDDNGRTNAQIGCFDDTVIALSIALQMFEWSFTNNTPLTVSIPNRVQRAMSKYK